MSALANVPPDSTSAPDFNALAQQVKDWGRALGFQQVGIADLDLSTAGERLRAWLARGFHGEMGWMARHGGLSMLFAQSLDFARRAPEGPAITNGEFRLKIYGLC